MKAPVLDLHRANRPHAGPGLAVLGVAIVLLLAAMQYLDALKAQGAALDQRESAVTKQEAAFEAISRARRRADGEAALRRRTGARADRRRMAAEHRVSDARHHDGVAYHRHAVRDAQRAGSAVLCDWLQAQPGTENVSVKRQIEKPGPPAASVEMALQVRWKPFVGQPVATSATAATGDAPDSVSASSVAAPPSAGGSRGVR